MKICRRTFVIWTIAAGFAQAQVSGEWVRLFDGKTLAGWTDEHDAYYVEDGLLLCKKGGAGNLFSNKEYSDFELQFEFKVPPWRE